MTDFDLLKRLDLLRTNICLEPLQLTSELDGGEDMSRYLQEAETSSNGITLYQGTKDNVKSELKQLQRLLSERDDTIKLLHRKVKQQRESFEEQLRQVHDKYQVALANTKEKYESLVEFYEDKIRREDEKRGVS